MMEDDLIGRVDKLGETVAQIDERVARVEHEQRAMRSSIDQLTGEVRQLDIRLDDMSAQFDRRLELITQQFDKRLEFMNQQFDRRQAETSANFDRRMAEMSANFDRRINDMKWVIGIGITLIILLMTLFRFIKLPTGP